MDKSRRAGFTLIELMVTLSVAAILMAIAIPNIRNFLSNNRLTSGVNDLLHSIQVARTEAIKRQRGSVVVCGTTDPGAATAALTCTYNTFRGWFVFQDTNGNWQRDLDGTEPVIETHTLIDASVTVKTDANSDIVSFGPSGFANPAGAQVPTATLVMCDVRGVTAVGNNSTGRALFITATGRARASASYADVHNTALPLVIGGSCP
ncbi:MAG TPA: GspH/FimT family pseudopilin [Steroidobacteraceae bacterium]|nr:GspH/FimT family pseudopilin [Steroidobacteraceae bacterium]